MMLWVRRAGGSRRDRMKIAETSSRQRRCAGGSLQGIAKQLRLSLHQTKRAWETARHLIPKWLDWESHMAACQSCQLFLAEGRDHLCEMVELQVGAQRSGGSRLRPMTVGQLETVAARIRGDLPARRR